MDKNGMPQSSITVHVPISQRIDGDSQVVLHVLDNELTVSLFADLHGYYKDRLHRVVFSRFPRDTSILELNTHTIFVIPLTFDDMVRQDQWLGRRRKARLLFELFEHEKLLRMVNYLTAMGYPVKLPLFEMIDRALVTQIVRFYLHNRTLSVPIDPIHAMFASICAGRQVSFWKLASEEVERDLYMGEDGQWGPSYRLMAQGVVFGKFQTVDEVLHSPLRAQLIQSRSLEQIHPECTACSIAMVCRGYLSVCHCMDGCSVWRSAYRKLKSEAEKILGIVSQLRMRPDE